MTSGCQPDTSWTERDEYTITLDGRLPIDGDGIYHLKLLRDRWQTIHRITGTILLNGGIQPIPQKVNWESSHFWQFFPGDTIIKIYRRNVDMNGRWVVIDTQTVVSPDTLIVPTVNPTSYSNSKTGEINTMIGPVMGMLNDTLTIKCWWTSEWYATDTIRKNIKIVLD